MAKLLVVFGLLGVGDTAIQNASILDPASPATNSIVNLTILVFVVAGLIFLVVEGVLLYSVWRFRQCADEPTSEPPQVYGSQPIEVAWTAAPAMIVLFLVLVTTRTLWEVNPTPPEPKPDDHTLFVTVVAKQWWWEYRYDEYNGRKFGFITANELHIPASESGTPRPVHLMLQAADVCHSYWVPRLAGKMDAIPGHTNTLWLQCDQPGLYVGQCAEYCGTQHANMLIRVVVDPPDVFDRWLANEMLPAVDDPAVAEGRKVFLSQSCVNCHRVRGTAARGSYAPDLTHLASRETLAAGMVQNNVDILRQWIDDPQSIKPGCLMPAFGLNKRDRDLLVRYLMSLR